MFYGVNAVVVIQNRQYGGVNSAVGKTVMPGNGMSGKVMTEKMKIYEIGADDAAAAAADNEVSGQTLVEQLQPDQSQPDKVLTRDVLGITSFIQNPGAALNQAEAGAVAVFADDVPLFYALTPQRMAQLLMLERRVSVVPCVSSLPRQLSMTAPVGKFAMFAGWQPDAEFQQLAALWGIRLATPVSAGELQSFVSYWQAEGKMYHHIQWQQKLARSVQISRNGRVRHDIAARSQPDEHIPDGFQG